MCISTAPRNHYTLSRRLAFDVDQLRSQVNIKTEMGTQPFSQLALIKPTPDAENKVKHKKRYPHITVQHNYHDHSHASCVGYQEDRPARGGVITPFPLKLHEMLNAVAAEGKEDIVSWQPHGRCFLVHKPKEFVGLLPRYFKLRKMASFQRQLNLYGFQRLTLGRDRGGYYHELFLRNRVFLSHSIQRIKVKGTGVRPRSNPDQEPDFWGMPWISENDQTGFQLLPAKPMLSSSLSLQMPTPPHLQSIPHALTNDDVMVGFGSKTFHYLDTFQNQQNILEEELQAEEVDLFFEDFDWSDDFGTNIEDDTVFGHLLEQMIA